MSTINPSNPYNLPRVFEDPHKRRCVVDHAIDYVNLLASGYKDVGPADSDDKQPEEAEQLPETPQTAATDPAPRATAQPPKPGDRPDTKPETKTS